MNNKQEISIPKEINYLSEYSEELNKQLPKNCHYILDKIVTGCGATEYFLTNNENIILASPRKVLLQNKKDQHPNDVYLVINESEKINYDQDLKDVEKDSDLLTENEINKLQEEKKKEKEKILKMQDEIRQYYLNCQFLHKPCKILVTYDSLKYVIFVLKNSINSFKVIVDEFQSIFTDSSFKSTVELNFVEFLQDIPSVCYLSATPMLEEYLDKLKEFKNLPYYQFKWDSSRIIKPIIYRKRTDSMGSACANFIEDYLDNKFPQKLVDGKIIESKEVVFYINSIKEIMSIIRTVNRRYQKKVNNPNTIILDSKNINIICSNTVYNKNRLKLINLNIGRVPIKGESHKMFTFCTRTAYLGADFYSKCAYSVICSNSNIDSLALDISLDLPQIMGRQRLSENPFRHEAILFYKTTEKEITEEQFKNHKLKKEKDTEGALQNYLAAPDKQKCVDDRRDLIRINKYRKDYVGISEKTGELVYNDLVAISEERAFEVKQKNYKDDISLYNSLNNSYNIVENYISEKDSKIQEFFKNFFASNTYFEEKMSLYCEFADKYGNMELKQSNKIPRDFHFYYELLGTQRIKANGYIENRIKNEINNIVSKDNIFNCFRTSFLLGKKYTKKYIKETIQLIYDNLGIKKSSKSTDLQEYFEVRRVRITINDKKEEGFEILKIKQ